MHSPHVEEVFVVATPLTDPSVLVYISPRALFRWLCSVVVSGAVVASVSTGSYSWQAVHTVLIAFLLHRL